MLSYVPSRQGASTMTADPTTPEAASEPEPTALRAVPRTWSAVLADGSHCRHTHHGDAEAADDCAQLEEQVPGWGELGPALRAYRKRAGLLIEQVATALEGSDSKISRIETGQCRPSARDVRDLLEIYGVTGEAAQPLMELARQARQARKPRRPRRSTAPAPNPLLAAAERLRS